VNFGGVGHDWLKITAEKSMDQQHRKFMPPNTLMELLKNHGTKTAEKN
jgi:hypothetical protein